MATNTASLLGEGFAPTSEELAVHFKATLKGFAFLSIGALSYFWMSCKFAAFEPPPEASPVRAFGTLVLCCGMLLEFYVDLFKMPPPKKQDDIFFVFGLVGKPAFLTFWVLSIQTIYMIFSAVVEVSLLTQAPDYGLLSFVYTTAVFCDTQGVLLTLLFLKFNWFEEKWQAMRRTWEDRGVPFGAYTLLGHLPSLPVGVLDVIVKDRSYLRTCSLAWTQNVMVSTIFAIIYFSWIHALWAASGFKCWPYPFLHDLNTPLKRCVFLLVIIICIVILLSFMTLLANIPAV